MLPASTRLVIPESILKEYQKEEKFWGQPFNYLSYYYSFVKPSMREVSKGESAYYFPLSIQLAYSLIFLTVLSITASAYVEEDSGFSSEEIFTRVVIPQFIIEEYEKEEEIWGRPFYV